MRPATDPLGGKTPLVNDTSPPRRRPGRLAVAATALSLGLTACSTNLPQSSLEPAGPEAEQINDLFWLVLWIAAVIFFLVQGALIVAIVRFRRRRGDEAKTVKQVHGNTRLEVIWTIIPALILAGVAVPTVGTLFDLRAEPKGERLDILVTGHQWWWEYEYPEYGFITANELHIPAGETVYLTMTSADVIHSFWVPPITGKRDTVPGRTTHLTLVADEPTPEGEPILGQCAEFCGLSHANMRIRVFVHTPEDFEAWARAQAQPSVIPEEGSAAAGWETFQLVCSACHAIEGTDAQARLAPDLTHYASRTTFAGAIFDNTRENVHDWLRDPPAMKPMSPEYNDIEAGRILGMPNFNLTTEQIEDLIALLEALE